MMLTPAYPYPATKRASTKKDRCPVAGGPCEYCKGRTSIYTGNAKRDGWHLASRREVGISVAINGEAWHLIYEVSEIRVVHGHSEWRDRIDRSRSCFSTDHGMFGNTQGSEYAVAVAAGVLCERLASVARAVEKAP